MSRGRHGNAPSRAPPHPVSPAQFVPVCPSSFGSGQAGTEGGLAVATMMKQLSHCCAFMLLCDTAEDFPGWWQQQRTLPMVSPLLLEPFASALQARKALPGARGVSHHDLSKNPCSGIFLIPPSPWREVGGSTAPCSQRGVADAAASPTCFLFPPGKSHGSWRLHPINHPATQGLFQTHHPGVCAWDAHQGAGMAPCSPRAFQPNSPP